MTRGCLVESLVRIVPQEAISKWWPEGMQQLFCSSFKDAFCQAQKCTAMIGPHNEDSNFCPMSTGTDLLCTRTILWIHEQVCTHKRWSPLRINWNWGRKGERSCAEKIFNPTWTRECGGNGEGAAIEWLCAISLLFSRNNFRSIIRYFNLKPTA